ncbi:MAG TPA: hypothetical protein VFI34_12190 [Candidatus Limnocylindrales bacterium]|nr:hypothetical protein [Candidatus Limnocylindrales bacterium]
MSLPQEPGPGRGDVPAPSAPPPEAAQPRPWLERIGMAGIAAVLGLLLLVVAAAAFSAGELILAAMGLSGAVLTLGIGLLTLVRG